MSRRRRRIVVGIVAALALAAGVAAWLVDRAFHPTVDLCIENRSGVDLTDVRIEAGRFRADIPRLEAGEKVRIPVRQVEETLIRFRGRRPDGRTIAGDSTRMARLNPENRTLVAVYAMIYEDYVSYISEVDPRRSKDDIWQTLRERLLGPSRSRRGR